MSTLSYETWTKTTLIETLEARGYDAAKCRKLNRTQLALALRDDDTGAVREDLWTW